MRTQEFGVMIVMMVMRTPPNAAGAEGQDSKDRHQMFGQAGVRQDRLVLLVMIDNKKTENQQSGENTADDPAGQMEIPESSRNRTCQKKSRGQNVPPTHPGGIHRVWFGRQYKFFSSSHARPAWPSSTKSSSLSILCSCKNIS